MLDADTLHSCLTKMRGPSPYAGACDVEEAFVFVDEYVPALTMSDEDKARAAGLLTSSLTGACTVWVAARPAVLCCATRCAGIHSDTSDPPHCQP
jgi:hypothetical protein